MQVVNIVLCVSNTVLRPAGRQNTRSNAYGGQPCLREDGCQFGDRVFRRWRSSVKETGRLDVEEPQKCPCLAACASQRRQSTKWALR